MRSFGTLLAGHAIHSSEADEFMRRNFLASEFEERNAVKWIS